MSAYYNELDPYAAQWLRNLIAKGLIADGVVDNRSIVEVTSDDLKAFTQVHFFAGIGVWSHALRLAGWPDTIPVWTGSCPCQPFSVAGKGTGFADERHLWPEFFRLIRECRPRVVFGEQVASKDGLTWLDLVHTDMEGADYAFAAVDLCAAGIGAPHIRQRLYWVGDSIEHGLERHSGNGNRKTGREGKAGSVAKAGELGRMAQDSVSIRRGRGLDADQAGNNREIQAEGLGSHGRMADADNQRFLGQHSLLRPQETGRISADFFETSGSCPTNGFWRDADWLYCRDDKWRPVEPGTFPLAHGAPARVGRLRAYGNAIVPQVAQAVIESYMEARP